MSRVEWRAGRFRVTSYGNGLAYAVDLADAPPESGYFVQGDDASEWRDAFDAADKADKVDSFMESQWSARV